MNDRQNRLVVLLIFFLSGISGLIYQIVWTRMLVLVFGNTLLATSTVLSSFMAGLAAGSFLLGEYIDRKPRALLRLYAWLEAGIGVFGLLFPLLFALVTPLYTAVYQGVGENLLVANLFRFAVCFVLILLPTFCMGGTLPVLLKYFAQRFGHLGSQMGFLYGLNTAGAVIGCAAAGYWLLGSAGLQKTTWIAVAVNLGVAAVAWMLPERRTEAQDVDGKPAAITRHRYPRPVIVAVLVGIGLSGFCALAYEVLWARMLNLFLNNNTFSFTATIATFLLGIAVGSLIFGRFLSRVHAKLRLFAGLQLAIGFMAVLTPFLFTALQDALFSNRSEALTIWKTIVVMIVPTVMMGISVPLAVQICQWGRGHEGRSVGTVYAFNTIGSILGAFVAGFILIPVVGLHAAMLTVAALNLLAGALTLVARAPGARRVVFAAAWAAATVLLFATAPEALFRDLYQKATPNSEILHYKEGKVVNVVVYDFDAGYKDLHLNGIEEASSRTWHVQLFKLLGVLPMMAHEDPDEALMIAFGAGMSAGAAIQQARSLEVVDLNPDIHGPAEAFRRENLDVIDNPKLTLTANDGRNELLLDPKQYSVIISDATNPKMFDSWTLYTKEFYELTRSRLLPGGVFAQWLVYPLPGDSFTSILATFRSVFPHMSLWSIHGSSQCLMLGTTERLNLDYQAFAERLEPVLHEARFDEYGVATAPKFLSYLMLGEDELDEFLAGVTRISTDDLPYAQFQFGRQLEGVQECMDMLKHQRTALPYLRNLGPDSGRVKAELEAHRDISQRLNRGFFLNRWDEYQKAALVARRHGLEDDANVRSALRFDDERLGHHLARLERQPEDPELHNSIGYCFWKRGELRRAEWHLEEALRLNPGFTNARGNLAQLRIALGDLDRASELLSQLGRESGSSNLHGFAEGGHEIVRQLRRLRAEGGSAESYLTLARAYAGIGDLLSAVRAAENSRALAGDDVQAHLNLANFYSTLELVDETAEAYRRASDLSPGNAKLRAAAHTMSALRDESMRRQAWFHQKYSVLARADSPL